MHGKLAGLVICESSPILCLCIGEMFTRTERVFEVNLAVEMYWSCGQMSHKIVKIDDRIQNISMYS